MYPTLTWHYRGRLEHNLVQGRDRILVMDLAGAANMFARSQQQNFITPRLASKRTLLTSYTNPIDLLHQLKKQ